MAATRNNGLRLIGIILLLLGLFKLLNGGAWVVWVILGALAMAASKADALKKSRGAAE